MKQLYSHSDYQRDTQEIVKILKNRDVHLVSLYRGSLPLGVKLSNILKLPLSIIDFQSYDGNSNKPSLIKNAGIKQNQTIVILDDIYDTGNTLEKTRSYFLKYYPNKIEGVVLMNNKNTPSWITSLGQSNGNWIVFEDWEL